MYGYDLWIVKQGKYYYGKKYGGMFGIQMRCNPMSILRWGKMMKDSFDFEIEALPKKRYDMKDTNYRRIMKALGGDGMYIQEQFQMFRLDYHKNKKLIQPSDYWDDGKEPK